MLEALGFANWCARVLPEYLSFANQLLINHGKVTATKVLKDLDSRTKLVVANQRVAREPFGGVWLKTLPCGLPKQLKWLARAARQAPIVATCVASMVRLIKLPPSYNVETITSPCTTTMPPSWFGDFQKFIWKNLSRAKVEPRQWHTSTKAGPNGPAAVVSSGIDAIVNSMTQYHNLFKQGCQLVGSQYLLERYNNFLLSAQGVNGSKLKLPEQMTIARLAYLSDKAGKTRVVYILDYWWQELLKPLHDAVFKWLRHQPQDGTFDQRKVVETVKLWTKEGKPLWSFDLTAATDRWPKIHQAACLVPLAGFQWTKVWWDAMGIPPYSKPHQKWLRYGVGQPMGAYASWAALALAHHNLIRWIASERGVPWDCYVVLGDDVVIANDKVAEGYKQALTDLGVTISKAKSVIWENQISGSSAEFAKQILVDGQDFTPISPQLLREIYDNHQWWKFLDLLSELKVRFGLTVYRLPDGTLWLPTPISSLLGPINRYKGSLIALLSEPGGARCLCEEVKELLNLPAGESVPDPWAGIDHLTYLHHKGEIVSEKLYHATQQLIKLREGLAGGDSGSKLPGWLLEVREHPIWAIIDRLESNIHEAYRYIATGSISLDATELAMDAEFLEKLLVHGVSYNEWKDNKSRRLKVACAMSLQLLKSIRSSEITDNSNVTYEDW